MIVQVFRRLTWEECVMYVTVKFVFLRQRGGGGGRRAQDLRPASETGADLGERPGTHRKRVSSSSACVSVSVSVCAVVCAWVSWYMHRSCGDQRFFTCVCVCMCSGVCVGVLVHASLLWGSKILHVCLCLCLCVQWCARGCTGTCIAPCEDRRD